MSVAVDARSVASDATRLVMDAVIRDGAPVVIVDSPPGAGKTRLVVGLVSTAVQLSKLRVLVVAPRNEQIYEIARRLVAITRIPVQILHSSRSPLPADLAANPRIARTTDAATLAAGPGIILANVAKARLSTDWMPDGSFDLLVVDEAYQVPFANLLPLLGAPLQLVLVGDPGQLPPIVRSDTARLEASPYPVHWAAPKLVARVHADAVRVSLPLTWRFPQDTVDLVQPSLYPDLPFSSAVAAEERRLVFQAAGMGSPIDRALDLAAAGSTIVGLLLPERAFGPDEVDTELADLGANVAARILERGPQWAGVRDLDAPDIGIADPHVASGTETHRRLLARGVRGVEVTTPEVWQGRQRPILVVKHPLSGARSIGEFGLDPGRLCVMLSRHQLACVVLARHGIDQALDRYQHDSGSRPSGSDNPVWRGWLAHRRVLEQLGPRVIDA